MLNDINTNRMKVLKEGFTVDHKNSGAVLYKNGLFVKAFASDESKDGKTGLQKAELFVNKNV